MRHFLPSAAPAGAVAGLAGCVLATASAARLVAGPSFAELLAAGWGTAAAAVPLAAIAAAAEGDVAPAAGAEEQAVIGLHDGIWGWTPASMRGRLPPSAPLASGVRRLGQSANSGARVFVVLGARSTPPQHPVAVDGDRAPGPPGPWTACRASAAAPDHNPRRRPLGQADSRTPAVPALEPARAADSPQAAEPSA